MIKQKSFFSSCDHRSSVENKILLMLKDGDLFKNILGENLYLEIFTKLLKYLEENPVKENISESGIVKTSSKGFEFELVKKENNKESWKDLTTGLIWHDIEEGLFNHYKAMETFGNNLPTKEEFEIAEQHGFREILSNMSGYYFWSSSNYSGNPDYAYVLDGDDGFIYCVRAFNDSAVRCVNR